MAEYGGKQSQERDIQSGFQPKVGAKAVPLPFQEQSTRPDTLPEIDISTPELTSLRRQSLQLRRGPRQVASGLSPSDRMLRTGQTLSAHQPVQARGRLDGDRVHSIADQGAQGSGGALPYQEQIQASFGKHDISHIKAHTGTEAAKANESLGSMAYARGEDVVLKSTDLFTVAHEAAHVVQQQGGVHLKDGIGQAGDTYEQHADAVAEKVVKGESAEALLDTLSGGSRVQGRMGGNWSVQFDNGGGDKDKGGDKDEGLTYQYESGDLNRASDEFLARYTQARDAIANKLRVVCDPVAFMSDANYHATVMSGKGSSKSFFTTALASLEAQRNAALALAEEANTEMFPEGKRNMLMVAQLAEQYAQIYTAIRDDGRKKEDGKLEKGNFNEAAWREEMAGRVLGTIAQARGTLAGMNPEAMGPIATPQIKQSLEEMGVFVSVWPKMVNGENGAGPSKVMWASFAQAIQRYRAILSSTAEKREELDARGGKTSSSVRTRESGDIYGALQSFQNDIQDMGIFIDRIAEIEAAVRKGDYKSGDEASQAMIKACGGTSTDPTFQQALLDLGQAVYNESAAQHAADGEAEALNSAQQELLAAAASLEQSKFSLVQSKTLNDKQKGAVQNKNKEELDTLFSLSEGYYASAQENLAQYRALVADKSKYNENRALAEELHAQAQAYLRIARAAADSVNIKRWPQLASNVARVRGNTDQIATQLTESRAFAKALADQKAALDKDADQQEADINAFAPKKEEIPVNIKKTEADGTEIGISSTDFVKAGLTLSGPIPFVPPVLKWFFQLEGQMEVTSGIINNKDANDEETMVKVSIGGGLMLDLWFLTVQLKIQGSFEVKVKKSDVGIADAMMMGAQEMVNWFAARELQDVAAKRKDLAMAVAKGRGKVNSVYDELGVMLVNNYDSFKENTGEEFWFSESSLEQVDTALATLKGDIEGIFGDLGADDMAEAASTFIDVEGVKKTMRALATVPEEKAGEALAKAKQGFNDSFDNSVKQVNKSFDEIPGSKNNPDVEFTAAFQVSVGCAVRFTEKVSANVELAWGEKITDGGGETYQLESQEVLSGKIGVNIDKWAIEAGAELTNGPGPAQELKVGVNGKGTIKDFFDPDPPATVENFGQYMKVLRALNPNPASLSSGLGDIAQTFRKGVKDCVEAHKEPQSAKATSVKAFIELEGKWQRPNQQVGLTLTELKVSVGSMMDGALSEINDTQGKKPGLGVEVNFEMGKKLNAVFKFPPPAPSK